MKWFSQNKFVLIATVVMSISMYQIYKMSEERYNLVWGGGHEITEPEFFSGIDTPNISPIVVDVAKSLVPEKIDKKDPNDESDLMLLAKTICAEAGYTNEEDMFLVGNVIMNRLESPWYPKAETITDVIYQKGQYACTWDGNLAKAIPNELALDIAKRLLEGERVAPKNVIFQSQVKQGDGVWKKVGVHYYCYKNDPR